MRLDGNQGIKNTGRTIKNGWYAPFVINGHKEHPSDRNRKGVENSTMSGNYI